MNLFNRLTQRLKRGKEVMCVKMIVEIVVMERAKYKDHMRKVSEAIMAGKQGRKKTVVMTPEIFAKAFSAKRLEMLVQMAKDGSGSVSELARKLGRRTEVVYRDLRFFEQLGIVKLTAGERNSLIPELVGEIRMAVPLTA